MQDELTELLGQLVAIDSVNPVLIPGAAGEQEVAGFVRDWLEENGVQAELVETAQEGRPNVIATVPGTGDGRTLLLNAHTDTVGTEGMEDPFTPEIRDGRMYGRGSLDTKAGLAAAMMTLVEIAKEPLPGSVMLAAVADEEYASFGTEELVGNVKADGCIVFEPTDLEVLIAHRGFVWIDVEVRGEAAHGSRPDLGVDAIAKAAKVVTAIDAFNAELAQRPPHPLLDTASLHLSLIEGGQEISSYPHRCRFSLEVRTLPGTTGEEVLADIEGVIAAVHADDPTVDATASVSFERPGLAGSVGEPLVATMVNAVADVTGTLGRTGGHQAWMDAALLAEDGIPSVVFGPIGEGLHAVEEWVDLESVATCAAVTLATARSFCV